MSRKNQITFTNGDKIIQIGKGIIHVESKSGQSMDTTGANLGDIRKMIEIIEIEETLEKDKGK